MLHLTLAHCFIITLVVIFLLGWILKKFTEMKDHQIELIGDIEHLEEQLGELTNKLAFNLVLVRMNHATGVLETIYSGSNYDLAVAHYYRSTQYYKERGLTDTGIYQIQVYAGTHLPDVMHPVAPKQHCVANLALPHVIHSCRSGLRFNWVT